MALLDIERHEDATGHRLVVSPAHRRDGIGTAVLRSIFDLTLLEGIDQIYGEVERGNTAAERLVRAAGLVPHTSAASDAGFSRWALSR